LKSGRILRELHRALPIQNWLTVAIQRDGAAITARHDLSERQIDILFSGGLILWIRSWHKAEIGA
jgi:hypothetical protein